jgi:hypothetical protein
MGTIEINPANFALLTALLNGLGTALKAIPSVGNHWIPFILATAGGVGNGVLGGWTGPNVMVGVVSAFSAVAVHQMVAQSKNIASQSKPDSNPPT